MQHQEPTSCMLHVAKHKVNFLLSYPSLIHLGEVLDHTLDPKCSIAYASTPEPFTSCNRFIQHNVHGEICLQCIPTI